MSLNVKLCAGAAVGANEGCAVGGGGDMRGAEGDPHETATKKAAIESASDAKPGPTLLCFVTTRD
jgi:hypothetical protein